MIMNFKLRSTEETNTYSKGLAPHLPNTGDVGVVPSVVVHQDGPVRHGRDLVPVVPP